MSAPRKQLPSESYAARTARGRPTLSISMSEESAARLRAYAAERGLTLGEAIVWLLASAQE